MLFGVATPATHNLIYILRLNVQFSSLLSHITTWRAGTQNTFRNLHLLFGNHAWICIYLHFYFFHILNHFFFSSIFAVLRVERKENAEMFISSCFKMFHLSIATLFFFLHFYGCSWQKCVDVELFFIQKRKNKTENKTDPDYTEMSYDTTTKRRCRRRREHGEVKDYDLLSHLTYFCLCVRENSLIKFFLASLRHTQMFNLMIPSNYFSLSSFHVPLQSSPTIFKEERRWAREKKEEKMENGFDNLHVVSSFFFPSYGLVNFPLPSTQIAITFLWLCSLSMTQQETIKISNYLKAAKPCLPDARVC